MTLIYIKIAVEVGDRIILILWLHFFLGILHSTDRGAVHGTPQSAKLSQQGRCSKNHQDILTPTGAAIGTINMYTFVRQDHNG